MFNNEDIFKQQYPLHQFIINVTTHGGQEYYIYIIRILYIYIFRWSKLGYVFEQFMKPTLTGIVNVSNVLHSDVMQQLQCFKCVA